MTYTSPVVKTSLPKQPFTNKPKLIMTANLVKQINKLHKRVGNLEWSGELITSEQGKITDLDEWVVTAHDIFLVDVGSAGYTSYEVDKGSFKAADIVELMEKFPGLMDGRLKNHHIHTHHNMDAFFSGTDWDNLEDRACASNYFIMLIVNKAGKYIAKVAYKAKVKVPAMKWKEDVEFANNFDGFEAFVLENSREDKEIEKLVVMDMEVTAERVEEEPGDWFDDRFSLVEQTSKTESRKTTYTSPAQANSSYTQRNYPKTSSQLALGYAEDAYDAYDDFYADGYTRGKDIGDMTDKEWETSQTEELKPITLHQAYRLINSALTDNPNTNDWSNPLVELKKYDNDTWTTIDRKAEELLLNIDINIEEMFEGATDDWCMDTLRFINDNVLEAAKHNRLAVALYRLIKEDLAKRRRGSNKQTNIKSLDTYKPVNDSMWD